MINITEKYEYDYVLKEGFRPLIDVRFNLDIQLRVEIQNELFGKKSPKNHRKFYIWCWDNKSNHHCENCGAYLKDYNATNVSHIISKGANPYMMYDPRNVNILCFWCHDLWENGLRQKLKIFGQNKAVEAILKTEYQNYSLTR